TVNAKRYPADRRASSEQGGQRIATIRRVGFARQPFDAVVCLRTVHPLIGVRPKVQLKMQAAPRCLVADESQLLEIPITLCRRQRHSPNVVAGNSDHKWISEMEIGVAYVRREIIPEPQRQAEAIEPVSGKLREIAAPKRTIVEPRFVLDVARKQARDAPNSIRRFLDDPVYTLQVCERINR